MSDKDFFYPPQNPSGYLTRVSVLDRFQAGTATAKDEEYVYRKYLSLVIRIGRKKKLSDEDVKELISCVFIKLFDLFKKISQGERQELIYARKHGTGKKFRGLICQIIYHTINDIFRKKYSSKEEASDPFVLNAINENKCAPEEDEDFVDTWQKFILREAMQELKEEMDATHFQVFFQVKMRGKKGPQVAEVFRLTADNVNQICSRTQKKLLAIAKELSEEHPLEKMADDEICRYIYEADKEFQALEDEFMG